MTNQSEEHYKVIFQGNLLRGFSPEDVRKTIEQRMKLSEEQLIRFFSGRTITLKKGLTNEEAKKFTQTMNLIGLKVVILPEDEDNLIVEATTPVITANTETDEPKKTGRSSNGFFDRITGNTASGDDDVQSVTAPSAFALTTEGRYGRLNYIYAQLLISLAGIAISFIMGLALSLLGGAFTSFSPSALTALSGMMLISAVVVLAVVVIYTTLCIRVAVLRMHDIGLAGTWLAGLVILYIICQVAAGFIPDNSLFSILSMLTSFLLALVALGLLLIPGTKDVNKFGHPSVRGPIIALPVYLILVIASISFSVLAPSTQSFHTEINRPSDTITTEDEVPQKNEAAPDRKKTIIEFE